jgi:hypothetical protein
MQNARNSIKGSITGPAPSSAEQKDQVQAIIDRISLAKMHGVKIQYILPKSPDRLVVANQYRKAGAEIRLHADIIVSDLRYTVIDNTYTVLGLPSSAGENQPTREGYVIPSEALAEIFLRQFQTRWEEAATYDEYLKTIVSEIRNHNPNISIQLLSSELRYQSQKSRGLSNERPRNPMPT